MRYALAPRLENYVPSVGPWTSHEHYVREHLRAVMDFVDARLLTAAEGKAAQVAAEASSCGE